MAQFVRPTSDIAAGLWTTAPLWSKVDEGAPGDDVVITSGNNSSPDNADFGCNAVTDPEVSTGHVLRAAWNKSAAAGHSVNAVLELWQGTPGTGTLIATLSVTAIGETEVTSTYTLSGTEADSITDYSALTLRLSRQGDTGGAGSTRRSLVADFIELEVPDVSGATADAADGFELGDSATATVTSPGTPKLYSPARAKPPITLVPPDRSAAPWAWEGLVRAFPLIEPPGAERDWVYRRRVTYTGTAPGRGVGAFGVGLSFPTGSTYGVFDGPSPVVQGSPVTILAAFQAHNTSAEHQILSVANSTSSGQYVLITGHNTLGFIFQIRDVTNIILGGSVALDTNPHVVAGTTNGVNRHRCYVDGVPDGQDTSTQQPQYNRAGWGLLRSSPIPPNGATIFAGYIWNRELTHNQIAELTADPWLPFRKRATLVFFGAIPPAGATGDAADTFELGDTSTASAAAARAASDAADLGDSASTTAAAAASVSDGLTASDTATAALALFADAADTAELGDSASAQAAAQAQASDTVEIGDSATGLAVSADAASDGLVASDTATGQAAAQASANDALKLGDSAVAETAVGQTGTAADALKLGDAATGAAAAQASAADGLTLSDTATGSAGTSDSATDGLTFADTASGQVSAAETATDALVASDSASGAAAARASVSDGPALGESADATAAAISAVSDALVVDESADALAGASASASDVLTLGDSAVAETTTAQTGAAADGLVAGDSADADAVASADAADAARVGDSTAGLAATAATPSDGLLFGDSATATSTSAEAAAVTDGMVFVDIALGVARATPDMSAGLALGDSTTAVVHRFAGVADSFLLGDAARYPASTEVGQLFGTVSALPALGGEVKALPAVKEGGATEAALVGEVSFNVGE